MWPVCRHLFGRCVLWIGETENTGCRLSARVLALQCLCGGLPRGRRNPVTDTATDDGVLQVNRFLEKKIFDALEYFDLVFP